MSLTEDLHCGRQVYSITPILKVQSLYNHNMNWETGGNLRHMSLLLQLLSNKDRNPLCLPPWAQSPSSLFITALNGSPAFSFSLFWSRVIFQNVHQVISNFCMKSFRGDRYCCCCPVSILATHLPVVWSIPGVPLALLQQLVIWTLHSLRCCCLGSLLCPALCDPMDCSPPGYSVHGISQTRILH